MEILKANRRNVNPGKIENIVFENEILVVDSEKSKDEEVHHKEKISLKNLWKLIISDKKNLIFIATFAIIWTICNFCNSRGLIGRVSNYVFFANNTTMNNFFYLIGNIAGKVIVVAFWYYLLTTVKDKICKYPLWEEKVFGISNYLPVDSQEIKYELIGIGLTLIANNFLTGNLTLNNSSIIIYILVIAIYSIYNLNSPLRKLINNLNRQTYNYDINCVNELFNGMILGCLVSLLLIAVHTSWIGYLIGMVILVISLFI